MTRNTNTVYTVAKTEPVFLGKKTEYLLSIIDKNSSDISESAKMVLASSAKYNSVMLEFWNSHVSRETSATTVCSLTWGWLLPSVYARTRFEELFSSLFLQ